MSASKDKERGTWKIYLRYVDWQGMKQIHTKLFFASPFCRKLQIKM